ncbi:MAG: hypothetical protein ABL901_14740 [Hyphomicrobiaceae bacterium]
MSRPLLAAALFAPLALATAIPAFADCKEEVLSALDKQRKATAFRMETTMVSEQGPVKMLVEYQPPDRMRQIVTVVVNPVPVESILVAGKAWGKDGDTWKPLAPDIAAEMVTQLDEVLGDDRGTIGTVACLGSTAIDNLELMAYRVENDAQVGPEDRSPDAKEKARLALADEARPLRMFYIDQKTGLPMRSVFARANKLDKPIFKATYTYPADIKIEAPK